MIRSPKGLQMNEMDLYYRALRDFYESVGQSKSHNRFIATAQKASATNDKLEAIRTKCIIDEKWVAAIEEYLPFVEKAIREDRQFIRQEGDIVRIEKAKKVSKATVSHLARHSDFITHLPEDESDPVLPDKLYITENESNYAIYENRFLYMLLCYTRDFVELRYSKISELGNTYRGALKINKHIEIGKRTVNFSADLSEVIKSDPLSSADTKINSMIERLEAIRVQVSALLITPLMNEVSKAPMLRPPITRTNVLRMNNNFKNAVALYDYLANYVGPGYTVEEIKKSFAPFETKMSAELFETIAMLSHLTYKYGNGISKILEENYQNELLLEAQRERERKQRELELLRKRAHEKSGSIEEYLLALEEHEALLKNEIDAFRQKNDRLMASIEKRDREIEEKTAQNTELSAQIHRIEDEKEALIQKAAYEEKEARLTSDFETAAQESLARFNENIANLKTEHQNETSVLKAQIEETNTLLASGREANLALHARLRAYQWKNGVSADEDLSDRQSFLQLEAERAWFQKMFKTTWAQTKKRIRQEVFAQVLNGESMPEEFTNSDKNDNFCSQTEKENETITN